MKYHVRGVVRDTGRDVEFDISALNEGHATALSHTRGILPSSIELVNEGAYVDLPVLPVAVPLAPKAKQRPTKRFDTLTTLALSAGCVAVGIVAGLGIAAMLSPSLADVIAERDVLRRELARVKAVNRQQEDSHRGELEERDAERDAEVERLTGEVVSARVGEVSARSEVLVNKGGREEWAGATEKERGNACLLYLFHIAGDTMTNMETSATVAASFQLAEDVNKTFMGTPGEVAVIEAMGVNVLFEDQWKWLRDKMGLKKPTGE